MKIYTPGDSVELAVVIEIDHPTNVDGEKTFFVNFIEILSIF